MNPSSLVGHILELLETVDQSTQPADRLTAEFFRARTYLGSHDRRCIAGTVFGVIRHRRFAETLLEQFLSEHPACADLNAPHARYLPVLTAYSAIDGQAITIPPTLWKTSFPNHDLTTYLDWLHQHANLEFLRTETEEVRFGVKYSFQDWMVAEWSECFGQETESLLQALNKPAPITLRVNTMKASREECRARLQQDGVATEPTKLSPFGLIAEKRFNSQSLSSFREGWFEMQEEGSQLVSLLANPLPGNIVIDSCAGAGGKALHLADLMKNDGEIIAVDVDGKRLAELERRARRAGISIIRTIVREELQPDNFIGKADLVLIDAPCSGSGTIRRNPAFKWSIAESIVQHYAEMQLEILESDSRFLKQGGTLVYATCSLFAEENQSVIQSFIDRHRDFIPQPIHSFIETESPFVVLTPHHHGTDGFFVATMKRSQ